MKKTIVILAIMLIGSAVAQRSSYWGEYENLMEDIFGHPNRVTPSLDDSLKVVIGAIGADPRWTGTGLEIHDLYRDLLATELGITPPADWDADVTDGEDAAVAIARFLNQLKVNGLLLTDASQQLIIDFTRSNTDLDG